MARASAARAKNSPRDYLVWTSPAVLSCFLWLSCEQVRACIITRHIVGLSILFQLWHSYTGFILPEIYGGE